jgi:hypothetical protein
MAPQSGRPKSASREGTKRKEKQNVPVQKLHTGDRMKLK